MALEPKKVVPFTVHRGPFMVNLGPRARKRYEYV